MTGNLLDEESIFKVAAEIASPEVRVDYLYQVCGENDTLLARVETLLAAHDESPRYLECAPPGLATGNDAVMLTEQPGSDVGDYKLLEVIGQGGMGVVFRAQSRSQDRPEVALKIVKPGMDTQQVVARFEAERETLTLMDHPYIAKALDAGSTDSGRPYFVMELVVGVPITQYCDQHKLGSRQRLELFTMVCNAVKHAHMKGVIHRDVKPNNILVEEHDGGPVPKVIDFGIAKAIDQQLTEQTLFTHYGQLVGTPLYMSPEQAELGGKNVDTRTDIYSLGVLLYELLTGAPPFDADELRRAGYEEMQRVIQEQEPLPPSEKLGTLQSDELSTIASSRQSDSRQLRQLVRGELDWIVMKAIDKDRNRRYATADEFTSDVRRFLSDEPVLAGPPSKIYRLRKLAKRNRKAVAAAAVVCGIAMTAVAFLAVNSWMIAEQRNAALTAQREAERQSAIAKATNDFIKIDLFGSATRHDEPNRDLRVRDVLDRAALNIGQSFTDQPLVEAAVRATIGNAYRSLGEYDQAESQLRRSLQLRRLELGKDEVASLRAANSLAWLYHDRGDFERCRKLFEETLQRSRLAHGAEHPVTIDCELGVADLSRHFGELAEAEQLSFDLLQRCRQVLGPEHSSTLQAAQILALALAARHNHSEAYTIQQEVLRQRLRTLGPHHVLTLGSMASLAQTHNDLQQHSEAEELHRQVVETRQGVLGAEHPDTIDSTRNLALAISHRGRHGEAEKLLRKLLESSRAVLGPEHPRTLRVMKGLATVLAKLGQQVEAASLLQAALAVSRSKMGDEHLETLQNMHDLGAHYEKQRRYKEAEKVFRGLLTIQQRVHGEKHPSSLHSVKHLKEIAQAKKSGPLPVRAARESD